jgi:SAM-dependent methyltransferase
MTSQLSTCRACLASAPYLFLPMGNHAPGQMLIKAGDQGKEQPAYPLNTQVCLSCGLIQIADQIPADFFRHYLYVPSGAATMHAHFRGLANAIVSKSGTSGLIVDIGCNDGLLLELCNQLGAKTLGIDPAANIAEIAKSKGVDVHLAYFNPVTAKEVREKFGEADVIVTTNTFNHIGDLHTFMKGIDVLLSKSGTFVIEVPRAKEMLESAIFDNIYHEHVSEFSLLSLVKLAGLFDLDVTEVTPLPNIHGGSMRVFMTRKSSGKQRAEIVGKMLAEEEVAGMLDSAVYDAQARNFGDIGKKIRSLLDGFRKQGLKIAGYGASARGNTMITYYGIDTSYLDFLVDKNPLKHGMFSPNTRIPIKPTEAIETEKPDVLLVLAWNFFPEIKQQQSAFLKRGGKFVVPYPKPIVVG